MGICEAWGYAIGRSAVHNKYNRFTRSACCSISGGSKLQSRIQHSSDCGVLGRILFQETNIILSDGYPAATGYVIWPIWKSTKRRKPLVITFETPIPRLGNAFNIAD